MPLRNDHPPGAFTAPATAQSVQHKLNQKEITHEMAIRVLETIAYPCELGEQCCCSECQSFKMHQTGPDFSHYDHNDILQWLEREERQQDRREALRRINLRQKQEEEARKRWELERQDDPGLQFESPTQVSERLEHRWVLVYDTIESHDNSRHPTYEHCEEVWSMCTRMWEVGLYLSHRVGRDGKLFITVAANYDILRKQAAEMELPMRLKETMGQVPYKRAWEQYYVQAPNDTTFNSAQEQQLVLRLMDQGWRIPLEHRMNMPLRQQVLARLKSKMLRNMSITATFLCRLFTTFGAYRDYDRSFQVCCPKAHAAAELTEKDKYFTVYPDNDEEGLTDEFSKLGDSALKVSGTNDAVELAAQAAHTTTKAALKIAKLSGKASSKAVTTAARKARGKQDKHLGKSEMAKFQTERYERLGWKELSWRDLCLIVAELEAWQAGAVNPMLSSTGLDRKGATELKAVGDQERFTGLLVDYFPTHDYEEMAFFWKSWADLKLILKFRVRARDNEGKYTEGAHYNPYASTNSWVGEKQKPWQITLWYQPIDEIRDYFGDETALYFAWLGIYTKSLGMQSLFGVVTMVFGMMQNENDIDPDLNDFTMFYSVSVAVWSVMFLQRWHRRENELRFLWGTEGLADNQTPRMEFQGKLDVNKVTGRETIIEKGWARGFARKAFSWTIVMLMMVLTVASALTAEALNTNKKSWYVKFDVNKDSYLDTVELHALFDALRPVSSVAISPVQEEALLANWFNGTLWDRDATGWDKSEVPIGPYAERSGITQSLPVCDTMRGQCLGQYQCATWVAYGDCRSIFNATRGIPVHTACEQERDKKLKYQPLFTLGSSEPEHLEECEPHPETGNITVPTCGPETKDAEGNDLCRCGCVNFNSVWRRSPFRGEMVRWRTVDELMAENSWVAIGGLTNLILLQTFGTIFRRLADWLNFIENHRVEEVHSRALVVKIFLFEFVNNYFVMFYIAYLRHIEFVVGVPQKCDKSCLKELQTKLFIVFTGKTLFKKVPEYVLPAIKKWWHVKGTTITAEELELRHNQEGKRFKLTVEEQYAMEPYEGMFDNFSQMVTQFGYLALFAPACSLAPLLAFINNVTEIRTDAWAVCNLTQRPPWKSSDSIGAWASVLRVMAMVAVVVNSTMVFFVGSQMSCPMDKDEVVAWYDETEGCLYGIGCDQKFYLTRPTFAERKLGGLLCSFGSNGWTSPASSRTDCPVEDAEILAKQGSSIEDPYLTRSLGESIYWDWYMGDPFELDGIGYRVTVSRLWIWALCMEHIVLLLRFGLSAMAPTEPMWVETAKDTLQYSIERMKHDHTETVQEREHRLKRRAGRKSAKEAFLKTDLNNNGSIDKDEFEIVCKEMGMKIDKEDIDAIWKELDTNTDDKVTFEEFDVWWCLNGGKNKWQLKDAATVFAELDTDGSGTLDQEELMLLCEHLGMKSLTAKQGTKLMKEIDADGDGEISIEEFEIWWQENGGPKYKSARPPAPGDLSNFQKYQEKKEFKDVMMRRKGKNAGELSPASSPRRNFEVEASITTHGENTTGANIRRGAAKAGRTPRLCARACLPCVAVRFPSAGALRCEIDCGVRARFSFRGHHGAERNSR